MDKGRLRRYITKQELIEYRNDLIDKWINESPDGFSDEKTKLACYMAFQEIVEAFMDLLAMICRDSGLLPNDDYTNIAQLVNNKIFPKNIATLFREMNGLRNHLVHRYEFVDERRAFHSIQELHHHLPELIEEIKSWIKTHT